jgi:hypothetical protein
MSARAGGGRPAWAHSGTPSRRRSPVDDPLNPAERVEQRRVADYLRARGDLLWTHVPNESKRGARQGLALKEAGMQRGFPDLVIFNPVWAGDLVPKSGLAIELKRVKGGRTSPEQMEWLDALRKCGWVAEVACGAEEAIGWIEANYGEPKAARRVA